LQEQNRYQRALKDFSSTLIFIRDIKELSDKVVTKIMHSVKLEFCAMYLKRDSNFFLQSKKAMDNPELPSIIETDSEFIISLKGKNSPVLGDYLPRLGSVKLGLVLPLFLNQELYGLILLGSKTKDTIFTNTDEDVFSIVSNQISLALSEIYYFNQFQKATEEKYKLGLEKARLESAFQISESYRHELGNVLNIISTSLANLMFIGDYVPSKEDIEQTRISKSGIKLQIGMKDNITISANNNFSFALKYLLEGAIGAIEYTKPEDKLINIELTNVDTIAHLEISDTGQDVTTDKMYKGVGIERAKEGGILYFIARRIIFDHHGKFQMSSFNSGKGTSFIIELPLAKGGG
jgi:K+-sensing histidine kinase KdpD